jgi:Cu(I)/Ag(I) efflux system membrane fusion protein
MHPQIRQPAPGLCPICAMDLIPVQAGGPDVAAGVARFTTTEEAKALMRLETALVERRFVENEVRMVGKVAYDETRLGYITAWVPGRIDRMYADYTGVTVAEGDHMVDLYSPELLTAKEELHRTAQGLAKLSASAPPVLRETAEATLGAARSRLRRWGLTSAQIEAAEAVGAQSDLITIHAPLGGTVIERMGREGMYVETGERIYTIADLRVVWVQLDAYESDLAWLHFGQPVSFTSEAYPGETFSGKIAFIDPTLDPMTRTVKVRVNVPNHNGQLKPGMFVRGVVRAQLATGGRVMDQALAGKWISPMHPEIVKDGPGTCDVCGMPLVRAEDLGYVPAAAGPQDMPLVVPATAPLRTGTRAVVYVEVPDATPPAYEGRVVELGARAGAYFVVQGGLAEGERVVTHGNFKIDSELQIQARPSMMSQASETAPAAAVAQAPEAFRAQLGALLDRYLALQAALASDDAGAARTAAATLSEQLAGMDASALTGEVATRWNEGFRLALARSGNALQEATAIEPQREAFHAFSDTLIEALQSLGLPDDRPALLVHCPMAFDFAGADWIQSEEEVLNPYFGATMLRCGTVTGPVIAAPAAAHTHGETPDA